MQKNSIILQDVFLNQVRKDKTSVTIHLMNGYQLKGVVKGFDNFIIVLDSEGKQMVLYKHAISTITPSKAVYFSFNTAETGKKEEQAE